MHNKPGKSEKAAALRGTQLRIFVSSPKDVRPGLREAIAAAVKELNGTPAWKGKYYLKPFFYEDYVPSSFGETPQNSVNRYMMRPEQADIFICVFGHRFGSPMPDEETGKEYGSGTEYEFEKALASYQQRRIGGRRPLIRLYRWNIPRPAHPSDDERKQVAKVEEFFKQVRRTSKGFKIEIEVPQGSLNERMLADLRITVETDFRHAHNPSISSVRRVLWRLGLRRLIERQTARNLDHLTEKVAAVWLADPAEGSPNWEGGLDIEDTPGSRKSADDRDILDLFDEAAGRLLILGAPGSGKTFKMFEMIRALIERQEKRRGNHQLRAEPYPQRPVFFNLSSWARSRRPLEEWLVAELVAAPYRVPRKFAREWVLNGRLTFFLDGLDELTTRAPELDDSDDPENLPEATAREAALEAMKRCLLEIDLFHRRHPLTRIIVSCQSEVYGELGADATEGGVFRVLGEWTRLFVKTLDPAKVIAYLDGHGSLSSLRRGIRQDAVLEEMSRIPFLLNTMSYAYRDADDFRFKELMALKNPTEERRRQDLFDRYVHLRMVASEAAGADATSHHERIFSEGEMREGLADLTRSMEKTGRPLFFIEDMQPGVWLEEKPLPYRLYTALLLGAVFMGIVGVPCGLAIGTEWAWGEHWTVGLPHGLRTGLLAGGACFVIIGAGFLFCRKWGFGVMLGLALGIARGIVIGLGEVDGGWRHGLKAGVISCVFSAVPLGLLFKRTRYKRDRIRPLEGLNWNWVQSGAGVLSGVLIGITFWLAFDEGRGLGFGLAASAFFGVAFGLQGSGISFRSMPNQGIIDSLLTALIAGTIFGLIGPVCFGISYGLHYHNSSGAYTGLQQGVVNAILGLCLSVAIIAFGLLPVVKHFGLRFALVRRKRIPHAFVGFLEEAKKVFFLKRVGGGYIFLHGSLRDYFRKKGRT